ncbi:MAG: M20/M25/M40 family metallo-hydrolase [Myxococcaceae bacterium]
MTSSLLAALSALGLAAAPAIPASPKPYPAEAGETHLADLRQLTFGGENAEAYWSFDGKELVFQARGPGEDCDRIWRLPLQQPLQPVPVSSGQGATTCAYFLPGNQDLIYASTHLGGPNCPPPPDRSKGYVWALHPAYDIFRAHKDGTGLQRLTATPGYDAEGTVCARDGSIIFTSVRDGDLDLYRMDSDGKNVRRLTDTPGYDGGAFFSPDCTKIVWRASRPVGAELAEYRELLARNVVRPTKLEIWVANADGTDARQITYLDAASFGPSWFPDGHRILFSSNVGDPKGREFNLWAVNVDGTGLEQITTALGFDGFPLLSPDGQTLVFASNRATAPGQHDTNLFLAHWTGAPPAEPHSAADRIARDITWLAAPEREGRGLGSAGLAASLRYVEDRFRALGLEPAGSEGFRQPFEVVLRVTAGPATALTLAGQAVAPAARAPAPFSARGEAEGDLVLVGYGVHAPELGVDDWAAADVKGKVAVVRRFVPEVPSLAAAEQQRRHGDVRRKAWLARERGALALLVVDAPLPPPGAATGWAMPKEANLQLADHEGTGTGDAGLPVLLVGRDASAPALAALGRGETVHARLTVDLKEERTTTANVVGRIPAGVSAQERLPGAILVGAHLDHLGLGGRNSLEPDSHAPHLGADDNASGVAVVLEIARSLQASRKPLRRDVWVVAFSGEEAGTLGSSHFVRLPPGGLDVQGLVAMVNLDMVGRLRDNRLSVLGTGSAKEWEALVPPICDAAHLTCSTGGDGYGPSDHSSFFAAGVPVLHLFTGAHADYHRPSDSADKINAAGAAQVGVFAEGVLRALAARPNRLSLQRVAAPAPSGDVRQSRASLGTVPDYAGPPKGMSGVLLAAVRSGSPADRAGLRRGDILVQLGSHRIGSVEDFMFALTASKPGDAMTAAVLRDGHRVEVAVTLGEAPAR